MGQDGSFERWAGVVLGVVSLILALHLAKSYVLPLLDSHARTSALRSDSASRSTSPNHAETESDSQTTQIQTLRLRKESPKAVTGQDSVRPRERAGSQASGNSEAAESTRNATEKAVAASPEPDVEKTSVEVAKAVAAPLSDLFRISVCELRVGYL